MNTWTSWPALERRIPLDDLPRFHREFLKGLEPDEAWEDAPLRRVQGKVQAALKRLEREGRAKTEGETLLIIKEVVPKAFRHYAEPCR